MHIYAFGSICRGELRLNSDIDLLAIVRKSGPELDAQTFSIYSPKSIKSLWKRGNPFAWHLSLEAKLVFSADGRDFLQQLGAPAPYLGAREDCERFFRLFKDAQESLERDTSTATFDLSTV